MQTIWVKDMPARLSKYKALVAALLLTVPQIAQADSISFDIADSPGPIEQSVAAALAYVQSGNLNRAREQLESLRIANPASPVPILGLAELARFQGLADEASSWLDEAYEVAPDDWRVARAQANFHQALGHDEEAERWMTGAVALAPELARLRSDLGSIYGHQKRYQSAISAYNEALKLDPDFVPAMISRANIWLILGKPKDALEDFDSAIKHQPGSPDARLGRALSLEADGKPNAARSAYEAALEIDPDNAIARNNLAWLIVSSSTNQDLDLAASHAERAVELAPEVAGFRDTLATVYRAQGRREAAIREYRKAIEIDPALEPSAIALRELSENR
jgi:tetratricopeptide (TPR) repeat protein